MIRLTDANYADGIGAPVDGVDPVIVSSELFDQDGVVANSANLSNLFVAWAPFTDHDLTLTAEGHGEVITAEGLVAPLTRADYADGTGVDGPRMPMNEITWQMDGSQIYGSTIDARTICGALRVVICARARVDCCPTLTPIVSWRVTSRQTNLCSSRVMSAPMKTPR